MKRSVIITIEDTYLEEDTGEPQTVEDFIETVIENSALKFYLEHEFGDIKVLGITVE